MKQLVILSILVGLCVASPLTNLLFFPNPLSGELDFSRKGSCGPSIFLDVLARYKDNSYPVQEHQVITDDDHILTLFRI